MVMQGVSRRALQRSSKCYFVGSVTKTFTLKVKEDEAGGACSSNGEKRNAYRLLVGKPEGKKRLGRPRRRWVDNITMDLSEIGLGRCGLD
jgi:hypothetical protein